MGISAGTDLVYGFILTNPTEFEVQSLLEQFGRELVNGYDDDDIGELHDEQVGNSKYTTWYSSTSYEDCFSFGIVVWTHRLRIGEKPKQVNMPSHEFQTNFNEWCNHNALKYQVGFYTIAWAG